MSEDFDLSSIFDEVDGILSGKDTVLEKAVSSMLTEPEINTLILSFAQMRAEEGFTEEEVQKILDWALRVRMEQTMLELVLKRVTLINVDDTGEILFKVSPLGEKIMRKRAEDNR